MTDYIMTDRIAASAEQVRAALMTADIEYAGYKYTAAECNGTVMLTPIKQAADFLLINSFVPSVEITTEREEDATCLELKFTLPKAVRIISSAIMVGCALMQAAVFILTDAGIGLPQLLPVLLLLYNYAFCRTGLAISSKKVFGKLRDCLS